MIEQYIGKDNAEDSTSSSYVQALKKQVYTIFQFPEKNV